MGMGAMGSGRLNSGQFHDPSTNRLLLLTFVNNIEKISLGHATPKYHILKLGSSKLAHILSQLLLFLLIINCLLIGIVNPGMLNPGPAHLKSAIRMYKVLFLSKI